MSQFEYKNPITKEFILAKVTQEQIFLRYLGVHVQYGSHFCSPLRMDFHPTCSFKKFGKKILFSDWGLDIRLDCFDVVQERYDCSFYDALCIIAKDFGIADVQPKGGPRKPRPVRPVKVIPGKRNVMIQVTPHEASPYPQFFTIKDIRYLKSYHLSSKECKKFGVFGIQNVWINGRIVYTWQENDPAIGYFFGVDGKGNQMWKIYFYKRRQKDQVRFYCNTNAIQGWAQLPEEGYLVVITKSLKDIMVLDTFQVPSIAFQSESNIPPEDTINQLKSRFKYVYSLYDFDRAGIRTANYLKKEYGIVPLMLTDGTRGTIDYGAKDISDYVQKFGRLETAKLIVHTSDVLALTEFQLINP